MPKHLQREIENLKKKILDLGGRIEAMVHEAIRSIEERDAVLAQKIIDEDIHARHPGEITPEEGQVVAVFRPCQQ